MAGRLRVLILEDEPRDAKLMVHELRRIGFDPEWERVDTEGDYLARLRPDFDVILADGFTPGFDAMRAIALVKERGLDIPVIVVTGSMNDERAVEFMKCGAVDYLLKDRLARLGQAVTQALEKRRLAEEKQRIEEERNRFFTLSLDMMCIAGFDGRFKFLNAAWEATLGWPVGELLARPYIEFVHPDDHPRTAAEAERLAASGGTTLEFENRYLCRDGGVKWLSWRAVTDQARRLVYATARDTTQRRRAEAELRASNQTLQSLIQAAPLAVAMTAPDGTVRLWNRAAERMLGWPADDVLGRPTPVTPADAPAASQPAQPARPATGLEARVRTRGGSVRDVVISTAPVYLADGTLSGVIEILSDVTEQKALEAQVRHAQKMEVVGKMAAGVAHDFNNLLTIINGYSDLLLDGLAPDDPSRDLLEEVRQAGERSAGLTRQLLAFSRRQVLAPQALDLNAVVADAEKMLRRLIGEDVRLVTALAPGLGTVRADPGQMEQVLMNLAVNARDAMPAGGRLTVETRNADLDDDDAKRHVGAQPGPHVVLAVSDTGCGMTPEVRARIFEPFFTTKGPGKGTGLGLATAHGIVEQAGGHLGVDTAVGAGTTFTVHLPRVGDRAQGGRVRSGAPVAPSGTETILLVEDEDGVRSLARHILAGRGYTVLEAADGAGAVRLADEHPGPIHLLVTDVVMPGAGGRAVADGVAERHPGVRALFVSGYTDDAVVRQGILHEAVNFLQKPFTAVALAQKVREVLDRR